MRVRELPFVKQVVENGAEDRVFDGLLLVGSLVVLVLAVVGRSLFTELLAAGYITVFVAHVLLNATR